MSQYSFDATLENVQQQLLEASFAQPILVAFHVKGHGPSEQLLALAENLAGQYQGRFLLAKVDCDAQQMLAAQFQIQSVPTLYLVDQGRPIDGLAGPQTEQSLKALLDKHLPAPVDPDLEAGLAALDAGDSTGAISHLSQAAHNAADPYPVQLALARAYLLAQRLDEAQKLLAGFPLAQQDGDYKALVAELTLKQDAADSPEIRELSQALEAAPEDNGLRLKLAVQLSAAGRHEEALEALLAILRADLGFQNGEAKQTCLDILATLGQGNALAAKYRRQLFSLLY
ncbi:tetratricopeptide repeat protein [Gallaecimonas kandeliae]|uniref:tetratricopeptide repeat protein n=1 Tax=Gallaecimonas kandeliae TaxID=3029055 RepID=UPI0026479778|nr:tetratricopeptide repeat protein [Gallaecimonas kandeliae]WKE67290.1 tetratricopeptide repeat protein [Gallaecimonas kandeliae]